MRILVTAVCVFFLHTHALAQVTEPVTANTEQQMENAAANNEDQETEDDAYLQQMIQFIRHPIEINEADETDLNQLRLLSPLQVQNFMAYRKLAGKLIDLYELQAIPGWDVELIRKIRPYVIVSNSIPVITNLKTRIKKGDHLLLFRSSQVPERSAGYLTDSSAANFYSGSPQKLLLRYKYSYKNLFQYGMVAEKDAGEQFFKGKQKQGFDFYSAHIFMRKLGIVRALALGDFVVNLGQGLIQWQSLAFKKSADVLNIKREGEVIRPYHSAGEINFHRGIAITLSKNKWQFSAFASYRNLDANFIADTSQNRDDFISSLQTSGYHRTKSETDDKGTQRQLAFGGNFSYQLKSLHLGVNAVQYKFKFPLIKTAEPYNRYSLNGTGLINYSFDYSYTYRNLHLFGEAAFRVSSGKAFVNGLLISASSNVDLSLLYRNISKSYQSLYSNAFTEGAYPVNETGFYAGVSIKPVTGWRIEAYVDFYRFPWLKYRIDAPSAGSDYLLQVNYKPNKRLEIYTRYHAESKAINFNPSQFTFSPVVQQPKQNWRTQLSYQVNTSVILRCRNEIVWFDKRGLASENGYLMYFDFIYRPILTAFSGNIRVQYFNTEGYSSRLYAYENDVLYNFSIPAFYDKGYKYYINLNYSINKIYSIWIRWAQTFYSDKTHIGSGLDEIRGSTKSDIKLQFSCNF